MVIDEDQSINQSNPSGVGYPNDFRVSKIEQTTLIRQIKSGIIKFEKCPNEIKMYEECVCQNGLFLSSMLCKALKLKLHDCIGYWDENDEIISRARKHYFAERQRFRSTGVAKPTDQIIQEVLQL